MPADAAQAPGEDEALLRAAQLRRVYGEGEDATVALDGTSLTVQEGELVAIEGRSGSGKTTLLNVVSGLDRTDEGTVHLLGDELGALSTDERLALRADEIGFVFQKPALVPELTLLENVALGARIRGIEPAASRDRASRALADVDLAGLEDRFPGEVSGGEAQRASVARAFAKDPHLVLADEPTANLDRETAELVADVFRASIEDGQAAALVVTHDPVVAEVASRTHRLQQGRLHEGQA
jgi:putative ABC transport system ATP-binding protein